MTDTQVQINPSEMKIPTISDWEWKVWLEIGGATVACIYDKLRENERCRSCSEIMNCVREVIALKTASWHEKERKKEERKKRREGRIRAQHLQVVLS